MTQPTDNKLTRRRFIGKAALAGAALAASPLATARTWAAPLTKKLQIKIRQDVIPDSIMEMFMSGFNSKYKDISAKSSFVKSDLGWENEAAQTERAPAWYTEGEPCDLFLARGPSLAQLADEGTIAPLDDLLASSSELSRADFHRSRYGSILDAATYKEKLWGIPFSGDPYALFCNNGLFAAGGVTSPPDTWEQAIDIARRLTRDTNGDGRPDVFGYSQCSFQFPLQIITSGLDFVDLKNRRSTFDTPEALNALDTYRRLIASSPDHVDFEKNDIAMKISVLTNAYGRYSRINHSISHLPAGSRRANTYGDSDGIFALAVSAKSSPEKQAAAFKLIEYLTGERMFYKISEATKMLPVRYSILNSERYADCRKKNPQVEAFIGEQEYAVPKPCIPEFRFLEVVMREILYPVQTGDPMALNLDQLREHLKQQAARVNARLSS